MSFSLMGQVIDAKVDLTLSEYSVLMSLANHANNEGGSCYPTLATIARQARMDDRTVRRVLRRLQERGLISACQQSSGRRATRYQINIHQLGNPDRGSGLSDGNPDRGSGLSDGNPDRGSANPDRGSANPDRGSANPDPTPPDPVRSCQEDQDQRADARDVHVGQGRSRSVEALREHAEAERARQRQNYDQLVLVCHEMFDEVDASRLTLPNAWEGCKQLAAKRGLDYSASKLQKAFDSARAQRRVAS